MMRDFDFYGIVGVIAPGMVVIIGGIVLICPSQYDKITSIASVSVGSLGVGLIIAYVAGQLLQTFGNWIEAIWWKLYDGKPTDWIRTGKRIILADVQMKQLQEKLREMLKDPSFEMNAKLDATQWTSITGQIYAVVSAENKAARINIFNGIYGLCRGIVASLFVLLLGTIIFHWREWQAVVGIIFLSGLAMYRMHHFSILYARELIVQFLTIDCQKGGQK